MFIDMNIIQLKLTIPSKSWNCLEGPKSSIRFWAVSAKYFLYIYILEVWKHISTLDFKKEKDINKVN